MSKENKSESALSEAGKTRRDAMKKMAIGAAFTVPVVASFSMESMAGPVYCGTYASNCTVLKTPLP